MIPKDFLLQAKRTLHILKELQYVFGEKKSYTIFIRKINLYHKYV